MDASLNAWCMHTCLYLHAPFCFSVMCEATVFCVVVMTVLRLVFDCDQKLCDRLMCVCVYIYIWFTQYKVVHPWGLPYFFIHIRRHTYMHTYISIFIYIYTYMCTHIHTHVLCVYIYMRIYYTHTHYVHIYIRIGT